jgi:predicted dehydrogenase
MTNNFQKPYITAILIGAGERGWHTYGEWALKNKDRIIFIAVAEPQKDRRKGFSKEWDIPKEYQFESWEDLLNDNIGKIADSCFICTQDQMHTKPALKALELGYHVLLEKPMATSLEDCKLLVKASEKANKELRICHVVRYTTFFSTIKKAIKDGLVGEIINIEHSENVAYWHFGHSYVRGPWRRSDLSSPIILAKTCHDLDLLYWLLESPAKKIQSFGELRFYKSQNAPKNGPKRCLDGCPISEDCSWYAPRLYVKGEPIIRITKRSKKRKLRFLGNLLLNHRKLVKFLSFFIKPLKKVLNWQFWPATVITNDLSYEGNLKALKEGPYGRCVFHCDNNVPDHQTVNIEFENGITSTMTLHGHSFLDGRWIRISGTRGTIIGKFTYGGEKVTYFDHLLGKEKILWEKDISFEAHSDGDSGLMNSFVNSMIKLKNGLEDHENLTSARASLESHLMGFAAERSRLEDRIVMMKEVR